MILKMRMKSTNGVAWRLLDKIKKIDYEYIDEAVILARRNKDASVLYINSYPELKDKRIVVVYIVFEDGLGEIFYTDDMVYILNDNGKTCDTINT